jgi:hypothetical protein
MNRRVVGTLIQRKSGALERGEIAADRARRHALCRREGLDGEPETCCGDGAQHLPLPDCFIAARH